MIQEDFNPAAASPQDPPPDEALAVAPSSAWSRRARQAEEEEQPAPLWLITFADIMALMLTFFVLLYSMSSPQKEKWDEMTQAVNKGLSKFYSPPQFSGGQDAISIDKIDYSRALDLNYLKSLIRDQAANTESLRDIVLISHRDRLILSVPEMLLFEAGSDDVGYEGGQALAALADILGRIRNRIEIIGYTDPRPVGAEGGAYASNWDLSLSRALSVAAVMRGAGYEKPVTVHGFSSARYDELPDDMAEQDRLDLSRRVDIVILKNDGRVRSFFR